MQRIANVMMIVFCNSVRFQIITLTMLSPEKRGFLCFTQLNEIYASVKGLKCL